MTDPPARQGRMLSVKARRLRALHNAVGGAELGCLGYLWFCGMTRRRDPWLGLALAVLAGEGLALLVARECPLGVFQRRAGDDVPMFELWFGPRAAPFAIPVLTVTALAGLGLVLARPPRFGGRSTPHGRPASPDKAGVIRTAVPGREPSLDD